MALRLELHVPDGEELWFRREMLSTPETMSYNANWDIPHPGYQRETGCIAYTITQEDAWYKHYIGCEPERYFAYVRRISDGVFIGDVCVHHAPEDGWWDMEVLIHAPYRGHGYGSEALKLLLRHAFLRLNVARVHNCFEAERGGGCALQTHLSAGFAVYRVEHGLTHVMLTREEYLRRPQAQGIDQ